MNAEEFEKLWGSQATSESFDGWTIQEIENSLFVMYPDLGDAEIYCLAQETFNYGR